jgi:hypothetical protein
MGAAPDDTVGSADVPVLDVPVSDQSRDDAPAGRQRRPWDQFDQWS